MSDVKLMAHMVAGYPDLDGSLAVAAALVAGGADYLEIQFPFSDPSADGPVIEKASHAALASGFTVDDGFRLLKVIGAMAGAPLFVMTYASIVHARGVGRFTQDAARVGVRGLIVPDLPPDYDEGLYRAGAKAGLAIVPVLSPNIPEERLEMVRAMRPEYVYTALRSGVTGRKTELDDDANRYLARVAAVGARIIAGFGVRSREQMAALSGKVHAAAVGSYFIEQMNDGDEDLEAVRLACAALKN